MTFPSELTSGDPAAAHRLRIDVWSDIACPWCYVGKRRLEGALADFAARGAVDVVWRSFELNPSAPREISDGSSYVARLAKKYGLPVGDAEAMIARMTAVAEVDGLNFDFARIRPGNTFGAHRLLHLAREQQRQDQVKERLFRAYLCEGAPIGEPETLQRLATEAGLDREATRAALESDAYAQAVRDDEDEAKELGVRGVPFFVLGGRYAVSGAQPSDLLRGALEQAWAAIETPPSSADEGRICGPDGCAE